MTELLPTITKEHLHKVGINPKLATSKSFVQLCNLLLDGDWHPFVDFYHLIEDTINPDTAVKAYMGRLERHRRDQGKDMPVEFKIAQGKNRIILRMINHYQRSGYLETDGRGLQMQVRLADDWLHKLRSVVGLPTDNLPLPQPHPVNVNSISKQQTELSFLQRSLRSWLGQSDADITKDLDKLTLDQLTQLYEDAEEELSRYADKLNKLIGKFILTKLGSSKLRKVLEEEPPSDQEVIGHIRENSIKDLLNEQR